MLYLPSSGLSLHQMLYSIDREILFSKKIKCFEVTRSMLAAIFSGTDTSINT